MGHVAGSQQGIYMEMIVLMRTLRSSDTKSDLSACCG